MYSYSEIGSIERTLSFCLSHWRLDKKGRGGGGFSRESSVTPKDLTFSRISVLSYFKDPNRGYFVQPVKNIEAKKCMTQ